MKTFGGLASAKGIYDAEDLESDDDPRPAWDQRSERAGEGAGGLSLGGLGAVAVPPTEPEAEHVMGPVIRVLWDIESAVERALREAGITEIRFHVSVSNDDPPTYVIRLGSTVLVGEVTYVGPASIEQAVDLARAHVAPR